jgi:hypothetical protein
VSDGHSGGYQRNYLRIAMHSDTDCFLNALGPADTAPIFTLLASRQVLGRDTCPLNLPLRSDELVDVLALPQVA